jgi:hypothetical protein
LHQLSFDHHERLPTQIVAPNPPGAGTHHPPLTPPSDGLYQFSPLSIAVLAMGRGRRWGRVGDGPGVGFRWDSPAHIQGQTRVSALKRRPSFDWFPLFPEKLPTSLVSLLISAPYFAILYWGAMPRIGSAVSPSTLCKRPLMTRGDGRLSTLLLHTNIHLLLRRQACFRINGSPSVWWLF